MDATLTSVKAKRNHHPATSIVSCSSIVKFIATIWDWTLLPTEVPQADDIHTFLNLTNALARAIYLVFDIACVFSYDNRVKNKTHSAG